MEPMDVKDLNDLHLMLAELFEKVCLLENKVNGDKSAKRRAESARKWIEDTRKKLNK